MGCGCGASSPIINAQRTVQPTAPAPLNSAYNTDQLLLWQAKLNCVKLHNKYAQYGLTTSSLNSHLGTVLSAIRNPNYIITFEKYLENMEPIIDRIPDEC